MTTDIVAQQVCTTTTSSSSKPQSTIIPSEDGSEDGSEDDAAATILLNLSTQLEQFNNSVVISYFHCYKHKVHINFTKETFCY